MTYATIPVWSRRISAPTSARSSAATRSHSSGSGPAAAFPSGATFGPLAAADVLHRRQVAPVAVGRDGRVERDQPVGVVGVVLPRVERCEVGVHHLHRPKG